MPKVRSATVGGVRIEIDTQPIHGYCEVDRKIHVDARDDDEAAFCTLVHEAMHQLLPTSREARILNAEREMCRLLLRLFKVKKREGAW